MVISGDIVLVVFAEKIKYFACPPLTSFKGAQQTEKWYLVIGICLKN